MVFLGERFRFAGEVCPLCADPGSGMALQLGADRPGGVGPAPSRWICSRCRAALTKRLETLVEDIRSAPPKEDR